MNLFTSESVSEGHPDKVADAISDAVLDLSLRTKDSSTRMACETLVTTDRVVIGGEYRGVLDDTEVESTVRRVIKDIGYNTPGFDWRTVKIHNYLHGQSADIALGTDSLGAGDQGLMFGYANDETPEYMPAALYYSHLIVRELAKLRHDGETRLLPDAKSQVTLEYDSQGSLSRIDKIVCSTQHHEDVSQNEVEEIVQTVISSVIPRNLLNNTTTLVNPTGRFVTGGPDGDCGLTGRKIIVDTYGGYAPHGGGAFSGKDPTKVDRSAAYMARYLAKNIVHHHGFRTATIQLSYAIGVHEPTSLMVVADGEQRPLLVKWILDNIDLTPGGIIERFDLFTPIYSATTNYGHFGKPDLPWEKLNW